MQEFNFYISLLSYCCELILLFFSFKYCYQKYNPPYLRSLPIYCIVTLAIVLISVFFQSASGQRGTFNVYTIFVLIYFSYFLSRIIDRKNVTRLIVILNVIFFSSVLIFLAFQNPKGASLLIMLVDPVVLVIICLVYFKIVFSESRTISLSKEPSFWLVSGILFHAFFIIPIFLTMLYFFYFHRAANLGILVFSMYYLTQIVSFVLFTKALICMRPQSI
jgi:hypothetical protein